MDLEIRKTTMSHGFTETQCDSHRLRQGDAWTSMDHLTTLTRLQRPNTVLTGPDSDLHYRPLQLRHL